MVSSAVNEITRNNTIEHGTTWNDMSGDDVQCGGAQCSALGGIDRKMSEKEEK